MSGAAKATLITFLLRLVDEFQSGNLGLSTLRADKGFAVCKQRWPQKSGFAVYDWDPSSSNCRPRARCSFVKEQSWGETDCIGGIFAFVHNLIAAAAETQLLI